MTSSSLFLLARRSSMPSRCRASRNSCSARRGRVDDDALRAVLAADARPQGLVAIERHHLVRRRAQRVDPARQQCGRARRNTPGCRECGPARRRAGRAVRPPGRARRGPPAHQVDTAQVAQARPPGAPSCGRGTPRGRGRPGTPGRPGRAPPAAARRRPPRPRAAMPRTAARSLRAWPATADARIAPSPQSAPAPR